MTTPAAGRRPLGFVPMSFGKKPAGIGATAEYGAVCRDGGAPASEHMAGGGRAGRG